MHGNWTWKSFYNSPLSFVLKVEGKGCISNLCVITDQDRITFPCTVKAGQYLIFDLSHKGYACITNLNYNTIKEVKPIGNQPRLIEGENQISFECSFVGEGEETPEVSVRYITLSEHLHETIFVKPALQSCIP